MAYTDGWKDTAAWVLDFSQPLKPTTSIVQQNAKQVIATATLRNIMTSVVESYVSCRAVERKMSLEYHRNPYAWQQT